ncbi:hypothetical protein D3C87_1322920 [compost metagenome]
MSVSYATNCAAIAPRLSPRSATKNIQLKAGINTAKYGITTSLRSVRPSSIGDFPASVACKNNKARQVTGFNV